MNIKELKRIKRRIRKDRERKDQIDSAREDRIQGQESFTGNFSGYSSLRVQHLAQFIASLRRKGFQAEATLLSDCVN